MIIGAWMRRATKSPYPLPAKKKLMGCPICTAPTTCLAGDKCTYLHALHGGAARTSRRYEVGFASKGGTPPLSLRRCILGLESGPQLTPCSSASEGPGRRSGVDRRRFSISSQWFAHVAQRPTSFLNLGSVLCSSFYNRQGKL